MVYFVKIENFCHRSIVIYIKFQLKYRIFVFKTISRLDTVTKMNISASYSAKKPNMTSYFNKNLKILSRRNK